MTISATVAEERMPVWSALSEFFLDMTLDGTDLDRISHKLAASRYSEMELEAILRYEVSPVCHWNLLDIAGEWAGFDEGWLREKITPRIGKRPRFHRSAFWPKSSLPREWKIVKEKLRILRMDEKKPNSKHSAAP